MFQEYLKDLFYTSHAPSVAIGFLCHDVVDFNLFTFQITIFLLLLLITRKITIHFNSYAHSKINLSLMVMKIWDSNFGSSAEYKL